MAEDALIKTLEELGDGIVKDMKALIKMNGSYASGNLYRSVRSFAKKRAGGTYELIIDYVYYGLFVDKGRNPGKQPPLDDIREWCRLKGIPEEAAYPIARKIGKKGYKGKPFTGKAVADYAVISKIMGEMGKAFKNNIEEQIMADNKFFGVPGFPKGSFAAIKKTGGL